MCFSKTGESYGWLKPRTHDFQAWFCPDCQSLWDLLSHVKSVSISLDLVSCMGGSTTQFSSNLRFWTVYKPVCTVANKQARMGHKQADRSFAAKQWGEHRSRWIVKKEDKLVELWQSCQSSHLVSWMLVLMCVAPTFLAIALNLAETIMLCVLIQ